MLIFEHASSSQSCPALILATEKGDEAIVQALLAAGSDVFAKDAVRMMTIDALKRVAD